MRIERTTDAALITRCVTNPQVWPHVHDDFSCKPEYYEPLIIPDVYWLMAIDRDLVGVFFLHPLNGVCFEIHTCLLPEVWGRTKECTLAVIEWIFSHTRCQRLVTNVPEYNALALRLAKRSGLTQFGINHKSYLKDGVLHDQIMLGISKKETSCQ
ncbi:MAG: GNAT family N-acetyltransferase [Burkholderiales bacterium]